MSNGETDESPRDMTLSNFGEILKTLCERFDKVRLAVFYDALGETIDYFSHRDPFETRLVAAYCGLIFETTRHRCKWLGLGAVDTIEIFNTDQESVTVGIGEGVFLTVVGSPGFINSDLYASLKKIKTLLRDEAGF